MKGVRHDVDDIKMQLLYQEHSRRDNRMFIGIEENDSTQSDGENGATSNQTTENTKEVIYNFMEKELHIENARGRFEFQRVHRVGKPKGRKSRPIITRFLRYSDCEEVLYQAKKTLKDKTFSVLEDLPKELYELRKSV